MTRMFILSPMLRTLKISKHIIVVTLFALLSICVHSTLSIPLRPLPRDESAPVFPQLNGSSPPPTDETPLPSQSGSTILEVLVLLPNPQEENQIEDGCTEEQRAILQISLGIASKWADDAYSVFKDRSAEELVKLQGVQKLLSPDGSISNAAFHKKLSQALDDAQKQAGDRKLADAELKLATEHFEQEYRKEDFKSDLQDDAKNHLYLVSKSLESAPRLGIIYALPPVNNNTVSSHIVFVCPQSGEDENEIFNYPVEVAPDNEEGRMASANQAIQKSIEDDEESYEKEKSNDALFPLPMNPVYMLLYIAQQMPVLLQSYRKPDLLDDLQVFSNEKDAKAARHSFNPEHIAPEDRSYHVASWPIVAYLIHIDPVWFLKKSEVKPDSPGPQT